MTIYFILLELFFYGFTLYILVRKGELSVIYLPVLFFSRNLFGFSMRAIVWYMILAVIMGYLILSNKGFSRSNPFAILLAIYFTILLWFSTDLTAVRPAYAATVVFFLSIPLIHSIYLKYDRSIITNELYNMAIIVLLLFISNVVMSSLTGYDGGRPMYGVTSIKYGNMFASAFNIVPIVLFYVLYKLSARNSAMDIVLSVLGFAFVMLSMRRSVMVVAVIAVGIFMIMIMIQENKSNVLKTITALGAIILIALIYTDVLDMFWQRYEIRGLAERDFVNTEESRLSEFGLVYSDMFIEKNYSPIFGYELFNSAGNYGDEIFGARSLHSDITVIVHASGLLGLMFYVLMMCKTFSLSYISVCDINDKLLLLFCMLTLIVFSLSGRFTSAEYMIALVLIMQLPVSQDEEPSVDVEEIEDVDENDIKTTYGEISILRR